MKDDVEKEGAENFIKHTLEYNLSELIRDMSRQFMMIFGDHDFMIFDDILVMF